MSKSVIHFCLPLLPGRIIWALMVCIWQESSEHVQACSFLNNKYEHLQRPNLMHLYLLQQKFLFQAFNWTFLKILGFWVPVVTPLLCPSQRQFFWPFQDNGSNSRELTSASGFVSALRWLQFSRFFSFVPCLHFEMVGVFHFFLLSALSQLWDWWSFPVLPRRLSAPVKCLSQVSEPQLSFKVLQAALKGFGYSACVFVTIPVSWHQLNLLNLWLCGPGLVACKPCSLVC